MSLVEYNLFGKIDKVQIAIDRIKAYDPTVSGVTGKPYYVAYSGGKDSDTIRILCDMAGVKYDLVHNHTTVDAPETVYYVRQQKNIQINYPEISMWELIVKKRMPPTRLVRYCCDYLKEGGGKDRFVMTGVRWEESLKRKLNRGSLEKGKIILNADNGENRRLVENCQQKSKWVLNPIIDWSEAEVWEFLNQQGCKSNPLYQCGYKRIGCIGCPMAGTKGQEEQFERYPKYKEGYLRAFDRMFKARAEAGLPNNWTSSEDVFNWWLYGNQEEANEDQLELENDYIV